MDELRDRRLQSGKTRFNRTRTHWPEGRNFDVLHVVDELVDFLRLELLGLLDLLELVLFLLDLFDLNLLDDLIGFLGRRRSGRSPFALNGLGLRQLFERGFLWQMFP